MNQPVNLPADHVFDVKLSSQALIVIDQLLQQAPWNVAQPILASLTAQVAPQVQALASKAEAKKTVTADLRPGKKG